MTPAHLGTLSLAASTRHQSPACTANREGLTAVGLSFRDELPFLDTDIARGTVLLTLDSFVFFLDEFGLPNEEFPPDTRWV
jgi:hypothetical protein